MAPSITIQMNRKRASSSVQMYAGSSGVKRAMTCIVTGTMSTATVATSSHVSSAVVEIDQRSHLIALILARI